MRGGHAGSAHTWRLAGGLMSYGTNVFDVYRQMGIQPRFKGRLAGGPAGRTGKQVRAGYQRPHREDARPNCSAGRACHRRSGAGRACHRRSGD
jgi:hypothetical protein